MSKSQVNSLVIVLLTVSVITGTGCVKFEAGQSAKEERVSQQYRAKKIRSEFASGVQGGTKQGVAQILVRTVEAVTSQYLNFGRKVGDQWHEGNRGRGTDIPAAEMLKVVNGWIDKEKPILLANEDNIEYAASYLKREFLLHRLEEQLIDSLVGGYYNVYNAVFYPSGTVTDYLNEIDDQDASARQIFSEFRQLFDL